MHCNVTSSERKCDFIGKVNTLSAFIQVLDIDFLRIRGLINASNTLWRTSQTSKSDGLCVNMGF